MKQNETLRIILSILALCTLITPQAFGQSGMPGKPDRDALIRQGEETTESLREFASVMEEEGLKMDLRIALVEAVKKDDLSAFRAAEAKGADLKYVQPMTGETILMIASYWGALDCVKYLVRSGHDPRKTTVTGTSSLHSACMLDREHIGPEYSQLRKKKAAVIRHYVSAGYGKQKDITWNVVWNVAHLAASMDNPEALEALKQSGIDIDAPMEPLQIRPLALVADVARLDTVKALVKLGARVSAETGYGATALDEAISGENEPVVEYLTSIGAKKGTLAGIVEEAMAEAEREEREEREALESSGLSNEGMPLVLACMEGNLARVKELVAGGMSPNLVILETTPLISSISQEASPDIARFLLSKGADPNLATEGGLTPLIAACMMPSPAFVKILLAAGAQPELDMGGLTPIEFARMSESAEIESILRKAGANK